MMFSNSGAAGGDGTWINESGNANYYDNVAAYWADYFRSGIDTYFTYAQTLARSWWTMPWMNKGLSCDSGGVYPCIISGSARDGTLGLVTDYLMGDSQLSNFLSQTELYWQTYDRTYSTTPAF